MEAMLISLTAFFVIRALGSAARAGGWIPKQSPKESYVAVSLLFLATAAWIYYAFVNWI